MKLIILTVTLLLFFNGVKALPGCSDPGNVYTVDYMITCLNKVPVGNDINDEFFDNIVKYIELSAFKDDLLYLDGPYADLRTNQIEEVEKMRTKLHNKEYMAEYQIHDDLIKLFRRSGDKNQLYQPPKEYTPMACLLPLSFVPSFDGSVTKYLPTIPNQEFWKIFTGAYEAFGVTLNQLNALVAHINNGDELVYIDGLPPSEFLVKYAEKYPLSKDKGTSAYKALNDSLTFPKFVEIGLPFGAGLPISFTSTSKVEIVLSYICLDVNVAGASSEQLIGSETATDKGIGTAKLSDVDSINTFETLEAGRGTPEILAEDKYVSVGVVCNVTDSNDVSVFTVAIHQNEVTGDTVLFIHIRTFDENRVDVADTIACLKRISHVDMRIIIDVSNATGNYSAFANYLPSWFNYRINQPATTPFRVKSSSAAKILMEFFSGSVTDIDNTLNKKPVKNIFDKLEMISYTDPSGTGANHEVEYSASFNLYDQSYYTGMEGGSNVDNGNIYERIMDKDRADIVIVTNGMCSLGCATFVWKMHEHCGAKVVTTGGIKTSTITLGSGFGNSPGSISSSSTVIDSVVSQLKKDGRDTSMFPTSLPRGIFIKFPLFKIFSDEDPTQTYEFMKGEESFHLFYVYDNMNEALYEALILKDIVAKLNNHATYNARDVELDMKRNSPNNCTGDDPHGVYGNRWSESTKNYAGDCVFMFCDDGYTYDKGSGLCKKLPGLLDDYVKTDEIEDSYIAKSVVAEEYVKRDSVETEYILKETVAKDYIKREDVAVEYVLRSEVETQYISKDIVAKNYMLKSTVESDYILRSSIDSNYIPMEVVNKNYVPASVIEANYTPNTEVQKDFTPNSVVQESYVEKAVVESAYTKNTVVEEGYVSKSVVETEYILRTDVNCPSTPTVVIALAVLTALFGCGLVGCIVFIIVKLCRFKAKTMDLNPIGIQGAVIDRV